MKAKFLFSPTAVANGEFHPDGRPKMRNRARVGRDGKIYFQLKPLTSDQAQLIRDMVTFAHSGRSIARTIGRSLEGTQQILRRMGLRTIHKVRLDEKNERRRQSIEARDAQR